MAKYDDASWHYGGDYPENLTNENAATHIGMFLTWCIENNLIADELRDDAKQEIEQVKNRKLSGAEFLIHICDEKLSDADLSDLGNKFAKDYYEDETDFAEQYNSFADDYADVFDEQAEAKGSEYESFYHVENTFENYELIKAVIDRRFQEWLTYKKSL